MIGQFNESSWDQIQNYLNDRDYRNNQSLDFADKIRYIQSLAQESLSDFIIKTDKFVDTELDLSCLKPICRSVAEKAAESLVSSGLFDSETVKMIKNLSCSNTELMEMTRHTITYYRRFAYDNLVGIESYYKLINSFFTQLIAINPEPACRLDSNDNLSFNAFPFAAAITGLTRMEINSFTKNFIDAWESMFDDRNHKLLAGRYLDGKIPMEKLKLVFNQMKQPEFTTSRR